MGPGHFINHAGDYQMPMCSKHDLPVNSFSDAGECSLCLREMKKINLNGDVIMPGAAQCAIDVAVGKLGPEGINSLRWRVGMQQLRQIQKLLLGVADLAVLRYECAYGMPERGIFMGFPYFLDKTLPDDQIILETVVSAEQICLISNAAAI